jgi:urea carboxylase-associated protein 2
LVLFEELLPGGSMWSHVLKRGTALRLTDLEGGANVGALFYNFENLAERLNVPDTLKAQHIARLTAGNVLYSDMGRILCSITEDTAGWHDPLGGWSTAESVRAQYGELGYQERRNDCVKNGRDSFLTELMKYGLEERDLVPCVNFFSKVTVQRDGSMEWAACSKAGDFVELRSEMNTLVVLHACPHPMDAGTRWAPKPVHLAVKRVAAPGPEDPCRTSRPENGRGFLLTERYFL